LPVAIAVDFRLPLVPVAAQKIGHFLLDRLLHHVLDRQADELA
jgi:hypothetical protein